jgi:uncharacterized glyoxalase superfamily protein PhnB
MVLGGYWAGLYGSCTDKYGINWMFNCSEKVGES